MFLKRIGTRAGVLFAGCFATAGAVFAYGAAVYTPPPRGGAPAARVNAASTEGPSVRGSVTVDWHNVRVIPEEPWGLVIERDRTAKQTRPSRPEEKKEEPEPLRSAAGMPERPSREQVRRTLATLRRGVQRCFDINMVPGTVTMSLTVVGRTGRVVQARVHGPSSSAGCIRALARGLRFPRFRAREIDVRHTYNLR